MAGEWVVKQEGEKRRLILNFKGLAFPPDVAQYPEAMRFVVDTLQQVEADELVLSEFYERIYNEDQTRMLRSIAELVNKFETEAVWSPSHLGRPTDDGRVLQARHAKVLELVNTTHSDPFKAYLDLLTVIKDEGAKGASLVGAAQESHKIYLGTLNFLKASFEDTYIIQQLRKHIAQLGAIPAARSVYVPLFEVAIKPAFIGSRLFFGGTESLELADQYEVLGARIQIFKHPERVEYLYYVNPPEYTLPPEKYYLLERTKEVVAGQRPPEVGFMDMAQARRYFHKVYISTIADLAQKAGIELSVEEKSNLATIVSRYTIGYGILEILLNDRQLTDVYIDSPLGARPIYMVHSKYGQCVSNIVYSDEEARSLVSRMRALSGRPFDEAHPILDYDLVDLQTRVAVIGKPLALDGIAFAFRLHKETPWTLPQFLDSKMFTPLAAGLFSYLVDAQASQLIVGSRGSGKCLEGDSLVHLADGRLAKIRDLVEEQLRGAPETTDVGDGVCAPAQALRVFTMTPDLRVAPAPASRVWKRKAPEQLYKIRLASGKEVTCTPEHPFFLVREGRVVHQRADELAEGEFIATPRALRPEHRPLQIIGTAPPNERDRFVGCVEAVSRDLEALAKREELKRAAKAMGLLYRTVLNLKWKIRNAASLEEMRRIARYLGKSENDYLREATGIRTYHSRHLIPVGAASRPMDAAFARFLGLLFGDGHLDAAEITLTNENDALRREFGELAERLFGVHGYERKPRNRARMYQITSRALSRMLAQRFRIPVGDKASSLEIPEEILSAPDDVLAAFIRAYFDCDSSVHESKGEIEFCTASRALGEQMQYALHRFGIVSFRKANVVNGSTYWRLFIHSDNSYRYHRFIGFGHVEKQARLERLLKGRRFNSNVDVVPNSFELLRATRSELKAYEVPSSMDQHNLGRSKLQRIAEDLTKRASSHAGVQQLQQLAWSYIFWDRVVTVEKVAPSEPWVYDLTVEGTHSFVANGIVAHNTSFLQSLMLEIPQNLRIIVQEDTQEIPVPYMKRLGFNIQRLKTRPPLGGIAEGEVAAEDALRTALRLGDSVLIVGEVRSTEAKALYEAMRVGAVGNVVMGTIHGESAYSIWDRVVNDLGVPTTSFKATDFCLVGAPIRFKGSLKRQRRIIEVTEVRKHWKEDPGEENGFLDWMKFDAGKDDLGLIEDNLKQSEWLKKVQALRGIGFEELWKEVTTRGASKQYLVDTRRKHDIPKLLEAENSVRAHNKLMLLEERQREEFGAVDHAQLLNDWRKWVDETLVAEQLQLKRLERT